MAEVSKPIDTMISAHAAWSDAAERQIFLGYMHDHVIEGDASRDRVVQYLPSLIAI